MPTFSRHAVAIWNGDVARVEGLEGIDPTQLAEVARIAKDACTISTAIRGAVDITMNVTAT